jgi:peptidoglycan/LPS O-acetylase OafA/YrhL
LKSFWIRRIFRLWPAAWCWLAFMVAGSLAFRDPPFMGTPALNVRGALAGVFAFANIRFGLHGFGVQYGPTFPYWSLSLEEQFYLILPAVIMLAKQRLTLLVVVLLLVQFPLAHDRLYFFMRNDGLLWGVLLAASPALLRAASVAARLVASVPLGGSTVLFACLAAMTQLSPPFEQSPPYWLGALAVAAAVPVWLAGANRGVFHVGFLQPAALWLGSRSYALYLCHLPIYQCAAALSHRIGVSDPLLHGHIEIRSTAIGLPLLAVAAEATYRLVETPLRRFGARLALASSPIQQDSRHSEV